jgi:hypothetical protein
MNLQILSVMTNQSGYAFLLFFAGLISIVNGASLLFDNRELNKYLSSSLLINSGVMLIFDSLYRIGYYKFGHIKVTTLVVQVIISFLSLLLIWGVHYERSAHIKEGEKSSGRGWGFFRFKKPTRRE